MFFTGLIEWLKLGIAPTLELFEVWSTSNKSTYSIFRYFDFLDHYTDAEQSGEFDSNVEINYFEAN